MASADATKLGARGVIPTYHTMDAGTLARALAAAAGRKGGRKTAQMVADFHNPAITQTKKTADKTEKMLGGMGGRSVDEHIDASMGGRTDDEHIDASMGGRTDDEHIDASMGGRTDDEHRKGIIFGIYKREGKVYKTTFVSEGESSIDFYTSLPVSEWVKITVSSKHGWLYDLLDAGKNLPGKNRPGIHMTLTLSNQLEPVGDITFSRLKIAFMNDNNIRWDTVQIKIDAKMLEEYEAEKATKAKKKTAEKRKRKRMK